MKWYFQIPTYEMAKQSLFYLLLQLKYNLWQSRLLSDHFQYHTECSRGTGWHQGPEWFASYYKMSDTTHELDLQTFLYHLFCCMKNKHEDEVFVYKSGTNGPLLCYDPRNGKYFIFCFILDLFSHWDTLHHANYDLFNIKYHSMKPSYANFIYTVLIFHQTIISIISSHQHR